MADIASGSSIERSEQEAPGEQFLYSRTSLPPVASILTHTYPFKTYYNMVINEIK
jgi:hypothetical protein